MNKLTYLIIAVLIILPVAVCKAAADAKIVPYYSFNTTEGVVVPNKGNTMVGLNLTNDIGLLFSPSNDSNQRLLGFYELKYVGPGLHKDEGEQFSDRWMDHIGLLRYSYYIDKYTSIKTQLDYTTEYRRTGTNEVWGTGLYDYNRKGIVLGVSRTFFEKLDTTLDLSYHSLDFPNYTDLLSEIQISSGSADSSAGKQNQNETQLNLSLKYGQLRTYINSTLMSYTKQKVVTNIVQPDGSFYSPTLQQDSIFTIGVEDTQKILNFLVVSPNANLRLKNSNQNYQFFKGTSTVPVQYFSNYYSYVEYYVGIPCTLLVGKRWELFYNLEYDWKTYVNRPPMDSAGNYLTGQQSNYLFLMSTGFTYKPNEVTRTTVFYTYQSQTSNMKYELYYPYNYNGNYIGINFNYTY